MSTPDERTGGQLPSTVPSPSPVKLQQQLVANMTSPAPTPAATPMGQLVPGNIDLHARPVVKNPDGSISTVRSITITDDKGRAILIPTVIGNQIVDNQTAINHYRTTGSHLGIFGDIQAADAYARSLHEDQAKEYVK